MKVPAVVITRRVAAHAVLGLILAVALAWRLNNIGFGLPSLYDPDEPIFMVTALKLLKEGTLNPHWFGHPASTTIYLLALIDIVVVSAGLLSGRYANIESFAAAAYSDPGLLFIPSRVTMALLGVVCVWMTYKIGRRLGGSTIGLVAATLLAINPLHITWSQVVRSDVQASVFMLGCIYFSIGIAERARLKDYLLAGAFVGFAAATKWPAASVLVSIIGAYIYRRFHCSDTRPREWRWLLAAGFAAVAALFLASPYLFLDWRTVLSDLSGEMRETHLGHTGGSFFENLTWYLQRQVGGSMGIVGLFLAGAGTAVTILRVPIARWTIMPALAAFLAFICAQNLIWSRWLVPVMPIFCFLAATAVVALAKLLGKGQSEKRRELLIVALAMAAALPSIGLAMSASTERANDTREQAARWAAANIPAGSSVILEHLELRLRDRPWKILFPIGDAGCVDAVQLLRTGVQYDKVQQLRKGSPIVDLGNVSAARIDGCKVDYAILTYYDLYRSEANLFPNELGKYQTLLAGGRTIALFRPQPGHSGGPVVRIVALQQH